jgi:cell wall-associated NlpC family hydrolase
LIALGATLVLSSSPASAARSARFYAESPSQRIITIAKAWVGSRYVWGGETPRPGFDCSGYVKWVYSRARVALLPHQSNEMRFAPRMHRIARWQARPGDLIFYMDGSGRAYHVSIFARPGWEYAAVDPAMGVRYKRTYSSNLRFMTDWH